MFVDELTIRAKAGKGGNGVVRWRREKFIDKGGPAGGDGGRGGHVYMRAVQDLSLLGRYTGVKEFNAENAADGAKKSKHGKDGEDLYIDIPVGATVREQARERTYIFEHVGQVERILRGGNGGRGNESFKSSTNQAPYESTDGAEGEEGIFHIELALLVDAGLIGLPNAGKTTLLNSLTHAHGKIGDYPFTTVEPDLGDFYGHVLADIPGLIEGAHKGKGLGYKFLRHIQKTKMLLHCVSLENKDPFEVYQTVRKEIQEFDKKILAKEEWIVLTKADLATENHIEKVLHEFQREGKEVFVTTATKPETLKVLQDSLSRYLNTSSKINHAK